MVSLNLPPYAYQIADKGGKLYIFDVLRKKYVYLTPEEWVRQHFVHFLINQHNYPRALMKNEGGLTYNRLQKRTDIVMYDREGRPFLVVECKGANIPITQAVFDQAAQYNHTLRAPYLAITNGLEYHCAAIDHHARQFRFLPDIPLFE